MTGLKQRLGARLPRRTTRAVWLLDTDDPTGATVMVLRRMQVLAPQLTSTAIALGRAGVVAPYGTPFRSILTARSPSGRLSFMGADIAVTTSERTLAWAAKRRVLGMRLVHVVHSVPELLYASERFMHYVHHVDQLAVPPDTDVPQLAALLGLRTEQVVVAEDFTVPGERLLSTAEGQTVLAVGRFASQSGVLDVVQAFAEALPEMPDWQLRLCGWGAQRRQVNRAVIESGLEGRAFVLGPTYDLSAEYLDAGMVVRVAAEETYGLSVLEALTAGVPVIGAETVPAVRRLVVDGVNGRALDRVDTGTLAAAMVELSDPERRAKLAEGARREACGLVTDEIVADLARLFAPRSRRLLVAAQSTGPNLGTVGLRPQPPRPQPLRPEPLRSEPALRPEPAEGREEEAFDKLRADEGGLRARDGELGEEDEFGAQEEDVTAPEALPEPGDVVLVGRREHMVTADLLPRPARTQLLAEVLTALRTAGVRGFVVQGATWPGPTVGVLAEQQRHALVALASLAGPGVYVQERLESGLRRPPRLLTAEALAAVPAEGVSVRIARLWSTPDRSLRYELGYGTTVEFWTPDLEAPDHVLAPRTNNAARLVHTDFLAPAETELDGRSWPSISLFERRMVDEVDFPIDAVYTWVDGDDPVWRERFLRARADAEGVAYHPQAHADNRYLSRDELRYSMRSLEMYAPWVRHIYLVTDGQVPVWLRPDSDRVTVVDHRDIFTDPSVLPIFNSSAIITQLHHIDGLSEHYLYLNDDMFFGRDVAPEDFWFGSGVAKVFPSYLTRPFGPAHAGDEPHVNITKNIRSTLEPSLGRSVSRAIRHTPYPQLRSVNAELEDRYGEVLRTTASHRFRHHSDIAQDQLFHYYAQATGRAVPSSISYDYVNVGLAESVSRLRRLLASRQRTVFCLNDAPEEGAEPMPPEQVRAFLSAYYPIPAPHERVEDEHPPRAL